MCCYKRTWQRGLDVDMHRCLLPAHQTFGLSLTEQPTSHGYDASVQSLFHLVPGELKFDSASCAMPLRWGTKWCSEAAYLRMYVCCLCVLGCYTCCGWHRTHPRCLSGPASCFTLYSFTSFTWVKLSCFAGASLVHHHEIAGIRRKHAVYQTLAQDTGLSCFNVRGKRLCFDGCFFSQLCCAFSCGNFLLKLGERKCLTLFLDRRSLYVLVP